MEDSIHKAILVLPVPVLLAAIPQSLIVVRLLWMVLLVFQTWPVSSSVREEVREEVRAAVRSVVLPLVPE